MIIKFIDDFCAVVYITPILLWTSFGPCLEKKLVREIGCHKINSQQLDRQDLSQQRTNAAVVE